MLIILPWISGGEGGQDASTSGHSEDPIDGWAEGFVVDAVDRWAEGDEGLGFAHVPFNGGYVGTGFVLGGSHENVVEEGLAEAGFDLVEVLGDGLNWELVGVVD